MRLVATLAQRKADIAKVLGDKLVERLNLIFIGSASAYELFRLCPNLFIRNDPTPLELGIPLPHFVPTLKSGHLHLGRLGSSDSSAPFLSFSLSSLSSRLRFECFQV